jgi:exopolysaccharide biosynthesis protein
MLDYNCVTWLNLDGGGSVSYFYKTNAEKINGVSGAYYGRHAVEMLYFAEK